MSTQPRKPRTYITRSKSGHYTVTMKRGDGQVVCKWTKVSDLKRARLIAAENSYVDFGGAA